MTIRKANHELNLNSLANFQFFLLNNLNILSEIFCLERLEQKRKLFFSNILLSQNSLEAFRILLATKAWLRIFDKEILFTTHVEGNTVLVSYKTFVRIVNLCNVKMASVVVDDFTEDFKFVQQVFGHLESINRFSYFNANWRIEESYDMLVAVIEKRALKELEISTDILSPQILRCLDLEVFTCCNYKLKDNDWDKLRKIKTKKLVFGKNVDLGIDENTINHLSFTHGFANIVRKNFLAKYSSCKFNCVEKLSRYQKPVAFSIID